MAVVVFPTPPFRFAIQIVLATKVSVTHYGKEGKIVGKYLQKQYKCKFPCWQKELSYVSRETFLSEKERVSVSFAKGEAVFIYGLLSEATVR